MKKNLRSVMVIFLTFMSSILGLHAQQSQNLHQVIIASGGAFSNPDDYVTVSTFDPGTSQQSTFATIFTQAVQDVLVDSSFLFVAATDSLVMFDLNTYDRIDATALQGLSQLYAAGDFLFVSIQYPETSGFLKVFERYSLVPVSVIEGVSDESAGMLAVDSILYLAVPGGWMSTVGKIAMINIKTLELIEEIDLGEQSVGIHNLFLYNDQVVAVCRTPWGIETGVVTVFDTHQKSFDHKVFSHVFGKGIARDGDVLYLLVDNGLGAIDLAGFSMLNPSVIDDPGSGSFIYFADIVFDYLNHEFYATTTDYFSFGQGHIFDINGIETGFLTAGISPEAIALDYRNTTSVPRGISSATLQISPNPASDRINIISEQMLEGFHVQVFTMLGNLVMEHAVVSNHLDIKTLSPGYYVLVLSNKHEVRTIRFAKING